ncbi:MAG TPA: xanthine dehydrogenase family protein subunit M [Candidatus Methylomirabilis sp.]|nr:xanthine dehydrogenase family protein subunit M [Candidatus Methylomirabilis sp.]
MRFQYYEPTSLTDAVDQAARFGGEGRFLAGGTDLMIQIHRGVLRPRHVVSLDRVPDLAAVEASGETILGAMVTHRDLEHHPALQGRLRALVEGAEVVGGHQIRNVATVGGNVVNASPAADVVAVLLALEATVVLLGAGGERVMPLAGFLLGPGSTARRPEEILTAIRFPALVGPSASAFLKAGRRRAMEISLVCVAAVLALDERTGRCVAVRVALGAVAPTTVRAHAAERVLEGRMPTAGVLREAGRAAAGECRPISDVRASARYRARLVEALVPRALARCLERIGAAA